MANSDRIYGGVGERVARKTSTGKLLFKRWLGCWIDFIALGLLFAAPVALLKMIGLPMALIACADLALMILYFPIAEGLWGRSLGKLIAGTIVVDDKGRPPGFGRASVRTLLRLVEVNPFLLGGLPAGLVSMSTQANQRVGDLLAGTYVVPLAELRQAQMGGDEREAKVLAEHFA